MGGISFGWLAVWVPSPDWFFRILEEWDVCMTGLRKVGVFIQEKVRLFLHKYSNFSQSSHTSHLPAYEDGTECSETSAYKIQRPRNYPEESTHLEVFSTVLNSQNCIRHHLYYTGFMKFVLSGLVEKQEI